MATKHYLDIVLVQEKLSSGETVYVSHCNGLGIASQGSTIEEATKNIKEAISLYLEEFPEKLDDFESGSPPTFSFVEVTHNAKAACSVR
ncbi:MAG: type II toxin-antitoxin system HicB family antitoxin [Nanoarchaeota archaeon]